MFCLLFTQDQTETDFFDSYQLNQRQLLCATREKRMRHSCDLNTGVSGCSQPESPAKGESFTLLSKIVQLAQLTESQSFGRNRKETRWSSYTENPIPSKPKNGNDIIKMGMYLKHPPSVMYLPSLSLM